jgi:hypothetical protein
VNYVQLIQAPALNAAGRPSKEQSERARARDQVQAADPKRKGKRVEKQRPTRDTPKVKHMVRGWFADEAEAYLAGQAEDPIDAMADHLDTASNQKRGHLKKTKKPRNPTMRQYIQKKPKREEGIQLAGSLLQQPVMMTIQEALTHVTCFRELLYGSLHDELAANIALELEAAVTVSGPLTLDHVSCLVTSATLSSRSTSLLVL